MLGNLAPLIAREVNAQQSLVPKALFEQVAGQVLERAKHGFEDGLRDLVEKVREREAALTDDDIAAEFDAALHQLQSEAEAVLRSGGVSTDVDIRKFMTSLQHDSNDARRQIFDTNYIKRLERERQQKENELVERWGGWARKAGLS